MLRPFHFLIYVSFLLLTQSAKGQLVFIESALDHGIKHVSLASDFMGAAVAVFDYNNDGWQDVYLTGGLDPDKLYKNLGNGVFKDVTAEAGAFQASIGFKTTAVVAADLNNDGYRDIVVGTARNHPVFVYRNNTDGTFTRILGGASGITTTKNTQAIVAGDYDLDGRVDLFVINYVLTPKTLYDSNGDVIGWDHTCSPDEFYRNTGSFTFQEIGATLGVANTGCGLAGLFTDVDGDHKPDLYIANDFGAYTNFPNAFYKNMNPVNSFQDRSAPSQLDAAIFGMGIAQGDYDKDGMLDLYVTNLGRSILQRQTSPGVFQDVTTAAGVGDAQDLNGLYVVGWGTAFIDYDNNGFEDLFKCNGYVPSSKNLETSQDSENKLFRNLGNGTFQDVSAEAKVNDKKMHRGMAIGDFDNDGDEDMIVTKLLSTGVPVKDYTLYYINDQNTGHHWLQVSLKGNGTTTSRDAFGSTIKVHYGSSHSVKALAGGSSHASQNSSVMHFGLNTATIIDSVEVFWPGGNRTRVLSPPVDTHILIEQGVASYGILGCMNPAASNFNNQATQDYGCFIPVTGCTNVTAANYNPAANVNDGSCELVTAIEQKSLHLNISVYPNPMNRDLSISGLTAESSSLELFDLQGRLVYQTEISGADVILQPDIRPGLYYYRITNHGAHIQTGKVLKL